VIEVNLLPGGRKKAAKSSFSFKLPSFKLGGGGGGKPDYYLMAFVLAAVATVVYMAVTFMGVRGQAEELAAQLDDERQDSIRNEATIEATNRLIATRDSLAARAAIIQQIDAGRYVWAHLLDEVGTAVPEFLWLREVTYSGENPLVVRIAGRAGSAFAVTNFMRRLEASRFLVSAQLQDMQLQPSEENPDDLVQVFELLVEYEEPPLEELETVPLFEEPTGVTPAAAPGGN
jgi:Tfp pilus assembly protein PilN